ncbi:penicillin acylase [Lactobacillus sp. CBA3605]|uniref:linear amide C-N hydrolase n=1 Tax=Lactobacillus sp. CBA3605 TaxID=2099788 RepID=UPI000CFBB86C|nr:linear amide C-N hydrolase [Lactobacillus sp. CBA3605]AVK60884.1 penicillin acylase [Lactobacillus sp. CBA3605]
MCTSLTYTNLDHQHFFARTMDFPTTTPWRPIFLPRHYAWQTGLATQRTTQLAILGGGRLPAHFSTPLMADGLNESGITCAELYLPHAVHYAAQIRPDQVNLTPQDFILWALGEHTTLAAIVADLPHVNLVGQNWGDAPYVYPFHWVLSDQSGQTLVIEPTGGPLTAQVNPSGILTNTPILATHLSRLNQTLHVAGTTFNAQTQAAAKNWLVTNHPLPTGSIPTERFVQMAIRRWGTPTLSAAATVPTILTWLTAVSLPYDPARRNQVSHNYTHYQGLINLTTQTYYFRPRTTQRLQTIALTSTMIAHWTQPKVYSAD